VQKLNTDLSRMNKAEKAEKKLQAAEKKARSGEAATLSRLNTQEQQIVDQFVQNSSTMTTDQMTKLLGQLVQIGGQEQTAKDGLSSTLAKDGKSLAADKKTFAKERKAGLKDLKPAEYHLNLKQTNRDRKELGLKGVKQVVRPPQSKGLTKAVQIAEQAVKLEQSQHCYDYTQSYGARTNYGLSPTNKGSDGRITFDCSGFVGAVYKAAGLPSPYTVGYTGTSFDVAGCKNMVKVSESQAKPGDVVVFPDHIALYIGHGNCISMGQEGDPKVVSVAAEAAYNNRGIQGFYHPRGQ